MILRCRYVHMLIAAVGIAGSPGASFAAEFYDINFEGAEHQIGAPPAVADGRIPSETPDAIIFGDPIVVPSHVLLSNSLEFYLAPDSPTDLEQIQFTVPDREAWYAIEFDLVIEAPLSAVSFTDAFAVHFDAAGGVKALRWHADGQIRGFLAGSDSPQIAHYAVGEVQTVRTEIHTPTNTWTFFIDDELVHETVDFIHWMDSIRMTLSDSSRSGTGSVLIDNIRIRTSPFPDGQPPCESALASKGDALDELRAGLGGAEAAVGLLIDSRDLELQMIRGIRALANPGRKVARAGRHLNRAKNQDRKALRRLRKALAREDAKELKGARRRIKAATKRLSSACSRLRRGGINLVR